MESELSKIQIAVLEAADSSVAELLLLELLAAELPELVVVVVSLVDSLLLANWPRCFGWKSSDHFFVHSESDAFAAVA